MAITETYFKANSSEIEKVEKTFLGCVVKVRTFRASRNHSDTMDYSDYRDTEVTEALVWVGRETMVGKYVDHQYVVGPHPVAVPDRFQWVDCTNLFVWRGAAHRAPKIDALALAIPELLEDLEAWLKHQADTDAEAARKHAVWEAGQRKAREDAELNRPVKGKRMVVCRGRKVPIGFEGTVAFVGDGGRVLLKAHHEWQNREAQGTWVAAGNLKALV